MLRLYEAHGARGEARLTIEPGFDGEAVRASGLEDPGAEVESGPEGIVVEYGPFEIVTLRVELER